MAQQKKVEKTMKFLMAEDDDIVRKSMATYLRARDYEVLEADNGKKALDLFRDEEPDLILTDLHMPKINGLELLTTVVKESPDTPVIIVSGMGTMTDAIEALRIGAWDYITKPVQDMVFLLHAVEKCLERKDLRLVSRLYHENLEETVKNRTAEIEKRTRQLEQEILERKIIENRIEQAKLEWERTVDAIPDLIFLTDRNKCIIRVNKAMADAIGMTPQEAVGSPCFKALLHGDSPPDYCPHKEMIKEDRPFAFEMYEEQLGGHFSVTMIPYHDPQNNEVIGFVHIARNINEQKKDEEEKNRLQTESLHSQKLESVGRLAAGIAHEINTPTQYVGSNIDFFAESFGDIQELMETFFLLLQAVRQKTVTDDLITNVEDKLEEVDWEYLKEEIPKAINQSKEGVHRVTSIVRAMKEFSHPGGKDKTPVDFNRIVENTVTVARNEWKYVAEVEMDLEAGLPEVSCLSDEMGQVILNMLVNAAHAIEEDLGKNPEDKKGLIRISTRREGEWLEMRLSDSGTGIPEAARERIFDPFFTMKSVGKGTGQGMAIARDVVVEKHGGTISFETELGKGTTFIVRLPFDN
ncbi:MAG: response regulator [Desulfobulbaceae bacterium]|nr:response regulator [Desulfobulbaceae bacterium]